MNTSAQSVGMGSVWAEVAFGEGFSSYKRSIALSACCWITIALPALNFFRISRCSADRTRKLEMLNVTGLRIEQNAVSGGGGVRCDRAVSMELKRFACVFALFR